MSFKVDYVMLDSTMEANRYIELSGTPVDSSSVALDTISGTAQYLDGDFAVDGTKVKWDSTIYGLYYDMTAGDKLRVIFDKS